MTPSEAERMNARPPLTCALMEQLESAGKIGEKPGGLPPIDESLHTPELVAALQRPALVLDDGETAAAQDGETK